MHNFKKLDIWNKSVALRFGPVSQMQRAEVSIPTNIAEGSDKSSAKEFARFLEMSLGSSFELEIEL
ncbi:MAG: four helix bundle protein [Bacteroidota bacterium]